MEHICDIACVRACVEIDTIFRYCADKVAYTSGACFTVSVKLNRCAPQAWQKGRDGTRVVLHVHALVLVLLTGRCPLFLMPYCLLGLASLFVFLLSPIHTLFLQQSFGPPVPEATAGAPRAINAFEYAEARVRPGLGSAPLLLYPSPFFTCKVFFT